LNLKGKNFTRNRLKSGKKPKRRSKEEPKREGVSNPEQMVNINIKTESHYTVNRKRIRILVEKILKENGVKGNIELSINIVGDRLMKELNNKYRKLDKTTTVLTFGYGNGKGDIPFVDPPDNTLRLGDIIISYPQARERALEDEMLVDDKIDELVVHGLNNLLG
jgi:probable rRNA maturation factor